MSSCQSTPYCNCCTDSCCMRVSVIVCMPAVPGCGILAPPHCAWLCPACCGWRNGSSRKGLAALAEGGTKKRHGTEYQPSSPQSAHAGQLPVPGVRRLVRRDRISGTHQYLRPVGRSSGVRDTNERVFAVYRPGAEHSVSDAVQVRKTWRLLKGLSCLAHQAPDLLRPRAGFWDESRLLQGGGDRCR